MSTIGQKERKTQQRVVKLFRETLGYAYLGNWEERDGNRNIGARTDAPVEVDLGGVADRVDDVRKQLEWGNSSIQLAAAVVRNRDPVRSCRHDGFRIVAALNPFDDDRTGPVRPEPFDVRHRHRGIEDGVD